MSDSEFSFLMQALPSLSAQEIAVVILNEYMTDAQAILFNRGIPVELLSEVMGLVE